MKDPRTFECPACFAPAGKPCSIPKNNAHTDSNSRVAVNWFHLAREGVATEAFNEHGRQQVEEGKRPDPYFP